MSHCNLLYRVGWLAIIICVPAAAGAYEQATETLGKPHRWYHPRRYVKRAPEVIDAVKRIEIVEMLSALAHGQPPDAGQGWFHDGVTAYGWEWLAEHYDANHDGEIVKDEFPSEAADLLRRLDRDQNDKIEKDDLDWSINSPYVKQMSQTRRLFGPIDRDRNGKLTKEEWRAFFDRAALDGTSLTPAELQAALFPPDPPGSDDPSPLDFLRGFVTGELGSISQGPNVGDQAPDFELPDHKHAERLQLSTLYDEKPVVLIFGSFT